MIAPSDLTAGVSYEDAEGVVRRIDAIERGTPGVVRYTVLADPVWPGHVGKNYTACPRWFADEVFGVFTEESPV